MATIPEVDRPDHDELEECNDLRLHLRLLDRLLDRLAAEQAERRRIR